MNSFVRYTGDNHEEVLAFTPGYVHSNGKTVRLHIFIPYGGDVEVAVGDYILKEGDKISLRKC